MTSLLKRASRGDQSAREELYPHIYQELKRLASAHMARERAGHTLQPTALLHEAYLRLIESRDIDWVGRGHFYATAAKVMRRILISHARTHQAGKRGGGLQRVDLDQAFVSTPEREPILISLDEALSRLELESPRAYQLVELKFFAGLSFEEAALALNVSSRTLKRDWETAKRWLYRELQGSRQFPNEDKEGNG
ncbi:sigma-70 family RNA polymerase sigma factor [Bryobacter aggregatus]|uniref:sigma-70 family RNA polymerase sigma factor n=1 Tax=Bryobacter aggregatus TaxID=360054 RepID=UPI001EE28565|nr:sigma-70 family RNA polymerase sigma factor [Bryobacter aggregatus]